LTAETAQEAVADPPCTESAAWPWVDVVFLGTDSGLATVSMMELIDVGLEGAIAIAAGAVVHASAAIVGFGKVGRCMSYMRNARMTAAPGGPPAGVGPVPGGPSPPATSAGPVGAGLTMTRVDSLQRGVQTSAQLAEWFGPPLSRTPINPPSPQGCVEVWTWLRGTSALSVAFGPDGTVCNVATAGPPLPP
jgi:hypothetical protein